MASGRALSTGRPRPSFGFVQYPLFVASERRLAVAGQAAVVGKVAGMARQLVSGGRQIVEVMRGGRGLEERSP